MLIYPFPMHLSQGYTYHLSIWQFLLSLAKITPIALIALDSREQLEVFSMAQFGKMIPENLKVYTARQRRFGIKSNRIWFFREVVSISKALATQHLRVTFYTRNVKQMALLLSLKATHPFCHQRFVFECHQLYSQNLAMRGDFKGGAREFKLEQIIYTQSDLIFVNTRPLQHQLFELFGTESATLPVAASADEIADYERISDGFSMREYDFVYAGTFGRWKGVDTFIYALGELRSQGWTGRALLIGARGSEHEATLKLLRERALEHQVQVLERIDRKAIPQFLDQARIGILPNSLLEDSIFNTSPLKVFDYAARGLHLVVSRLPALDAALESLNPISARPDDPLDWVRGLNVALDVAMEPNQRALSWASERTWDARADRVMRNVYESYGTLER